MTGAAILRLIGGVRAAIFAGLMLIFAGLFGWQSWAKHTLASDFSDAKTDWAKQSLAQANEYIAALQRAQQAEQAYGEASARAADEYQRGISDGQAKAAAVADAVRDGSLQLQKRWAGCETARLSESIAASTSDPADGQAADRAASAGRIVRIGSDADSRIAWLQSELIATRALCGAASQ